MSGTDYGKLAIGIIAAWFVFALSAGAAHVFNQSAGGPPVALGLAVLIPILVFWIWFKSSAGLREFALSLDPRVLTIVQSWRIAGFVFVVLYFYGILPGMFANPAGWGDIAIGLTAPWVAMKLAEPGHRKGFIFWNALGLLDLIVAVTTGTTSGLVHPADLPLMR